MVLTVTLNASLDVTYDVGHLSRNEPVRVRTVRVRPGGKGVNVAFVLTALGTDVVATGLSGGHRGQRIRAGLLDAGITDAFSPIADESRQTVVAMADDGTFAEYDEAGPAVSAPEWETFLAAYDRLLDTSDTVVCAGSLPPSLPADSYAVLTESAHDRGRRVVLDTSGAALRAGIESGPDLIKVSRAELSELAGSELTDEDAVVECVRDLGRSAIVTLGADGAVAVTGSSTTRVQAPRRRGNPVGAGDAFTAGLVCEEVAGTSFHQRLVFATALAASSVGIPGAGLVDLSVAKELIDLVTVDLVSVEER
jgi:tagatose 6-phosphate kinase